MESKDYQAAKKRVKKKKDFRGHLQSFITTNLIMLGMGLMFGFFNAWLMVTFFWGIGVIFHYADAYGFPGLEQDEDWEKREMEKELRRMRRREAGEGTMPEPPEPDDMLDLDERRPVKQKNYREEDLV